MFIDAYDVPFGIKTKIKFINIDKIHKNVMKYLDVFTVLQMDTICNFFLQNFNEITSCSDNFSYIIL